VAVMRSSGNGPFGKHAMKAQSSRIGPRLGALLIAAVWSQTLLASDHAMQQPAPLPVGATLPVLLKGTLDARHATPGQRVVAQLSQRVPLPGGVYLPQETEVLGTVVACDRASLTLQFTQIQLERWSEPAHLRLIAAADWLDVERTHDPVGGTDRGTSTPADWTTMQIGRDEIYYSGFVGPVYDQYSQSVGNADGHGVYAAATHPGGLLRSMGPFSTTAAGLYDLPGMALASGHQASGSESTLIVFQLTGRDWRLHAHSALLLQVAAP